MKRERDTEGVVGDGTGNQREGVVGCRRRFANQLTKSRASPLSYRQQIVSGASAKSPTLEGAYHGVFLVRQIWAQAPVPSASFAASGTSAFATRRTIV